MSEEGKIQSLIFNKRLWATNDARAWLRRHHFIPIKHVDITPNYYRYRIREPLPGHRFRMLHFGHGILAVIMY